MTPCLPLESMQAAELLANRRWWRHSQPFPHFCARDVLKPEVYLAVEQAFRAVLARGLDEGVNPNRLSRSARGYDAYAYHFPPNLSGPLALFLSSAWHKLLAAVAGVEATGDVDGGLHYHAVGSGSGRVHNDLNPGYFVAQPRTDGINPSRPAVCSYHRGSTRTRAEVLRRVRAVAMIFYLANEPWRAGDGGETALYAGVDRRTPSALVPPINNSLVLFECTPYSYHTFVQNRRWPRSSIILWLHRTWSAAIGRWGKNSIVLWPKR
jgi:2OG-Fe(II) oxygenase superfamily